jgi:uncharacterized protein YndB with AHSA1/START domain
VFLEKSIEIARPVEEVFDYVSDPRNDPIWCPKVISVEPVGEPGHGPGARFEVLHRPIPLRPPRTMRYTLVDWDPPHRIHWREEEGEEDVFLVTYTLAETAGGTRFTQADEVRISVPRPLLPLMKIGIGADVAKQMRTLRAELQSAPTAPR